jgi:hypothetical protein
MLVNTAIVAVWWVVGGGSFFWPIFVILFWGVGVVMNAWDVFFRYDKDEAKIQHEMDRLRRHDA